MSKTLIITVGWVYNESDEEIGFGYYFGDGHPANKGTRKLLIRLAFVSLVKLILIQLNTDAPLNSIAATTETLSTASPLPRA